MCIYVEAGMKNITLAVDEKVLEAARDYAARHGTTLNAVVREHLARIVNEDERIAEARRGLIELMENSTGRLGPDFKWNRDEIYEDRELPRHEHPRVRSGRKRG
jgi:antitoxin component of RelBE/YafQ-DinJ toxin-antitoxin module